MNRRKFFSRILPGAVGAAALAPKVVEAVSANLPDVIEREGITAHWLGWTKLPDFYSLWGAWQFTLPDGRMSYCTTGGANRRDHHRFQTLDMTVMDEHELSISTPEEKREQARSAAYDHGMTAAIAWMHEPPLSPNDGHYYAERYYPPNEHEVIRRAAIQTGRK